MRTKIFCLSLMMSLFSLVACKKQTDFDKEAMLEGIIENYVIHSYEEAVNKATDLEQAVQAFTTNPDGIKLEAAQEAWKRSIEAWSKVEGLNFGPGREQYRYLQLDNTPVRPNSIEAALADSTPIDLAFLQQRGSYTKGLATVEYLLFDGRGNTVLLSLYQSDALAARRQAYLYYTVVHALDLLKEVTQDWKNNYGKDLASLTDNSSVGGVARFSNALLHLTQTVARKKIGKPLGKESSSGMVQPSLVESPYGEHSWAIIHYNLLGLQEIFGGEEHGLGSYLHHLLGDHHNTQKIAEQLEKVVALTKEKNSSLQGDLYQQKASVETVYDAMKLLYIMLEEDYLPYVSVTLLTNPDDGD